MEEGCHDVCILTDYGRLPAATRGLRCSIYWEQDDKSDLRRSLHLVDCGSGLAPGIIPPASIMCKYQPLTERSHGFKGTWPKQYSTRGISITVPASEKKMSRGDFSLECRLNIVIMRRRLNTSLKGLPVKGV